MSPKAPQAAATACSREKPRSAAFVVEPMTLVEMAVRPEVALIDLVPVASHFANVFQPVAWQNAAASVW